MRLLKLWQRFCEAVINSHYTVRATAATVAVMLVNDGAGSGSLCAQWQYHSMILVCFSNSNATVAQRQGWCGLQCAVQMVLAQPLLKSGAIQMQGCGLLTELLLKKLGSAAGAM